MAPKIGDVRVKAVRRTKTGVEIETVTKDERERLQAIPAFSEAGLSVERARTMAHRVAVHDVPGHIKDEEFLCEL